MFYCIRNVQELTETVFIWIIISLSDSHDIEEKKRPR